MPNSDTQYLYWFSLILFFDLDKDDIDVVKTALMKQVANKYKLLVLLDK